jgi:hypothetical protein
MRRRWTAKKTIMFPFPSPTRQLNIEHSFYTIHVIQHMPAHTNRACHLGSYGNTGPNALNACYFVVFKFADVVVDVEVCASRFRCGSNNRCVVNEDPYSRLWGNPDGVGCGAESDSTETGSAGIRYQGVAGLFG